MSPPTYLCTARRPLLGHLGRCARPWPAPERRLVSPCRQLQATLAETEHEQRSGWYDTPETQASSGVNQQGPRHVGSHHAAAMCHMSAEMPDRRHRHRHCTYTLSLSLSHTHTRRLTRRLSTGLQIGDPWPFCLLWCAPSRRYCWGRERVTPQ